MKSLALLLALLPGLAFGQTPAEKRAAVEKLLTELKAADSSDVAAPLEQRIQQLWIDGDSAAVTLLMHRGLRELKGETYDEAIETFDAVIVLDPTLAEAWHRRGIARFRSGDTPGAAADFQQALKLEPRDFAAWRTLTDIAVAREDWYGAYTAWQKLLDIDPKAADGESRLRDFKRKAVGEDT
ncbi:MAG: tetratricopeptide repeat protein [Rhodospirillales bacterium]